ncbi:hypothetical protein NFI96_032092 [Prochilodus magdalenae]|nr:hypothetical protein NFI96_032092 [Prochilodus magdalenae]
MSDFDKEDPESPRLQFRKQNHSPDSQLLRSPLVQSVVPAVWLALHHCEKMEPILNAAMPLKGKVHENTVALSSALQPIADTLDSIKQTLKLHLGSIKALDASASDHGDRIAQLEKNRCRVLTTDNIESHSRRSNVRAIGILEKMEGADPTNFMTELLLETVSSDYFQHRPILERAYRLGQAVAAGGTDSNKLRLFQSFQDKERVLRRSRDGVSFRGHNIRFFQNYSADLPLQRAAFRAVKAALYKEGVRFNMLYPARLRVVSKDGFKIFETPEAAQAFLKDHYNH